MSLNRLVTKLARESLFVSGAFLFTLSSPAFYGYYREWKAQREFYARYETSGVSLREALRLDKPPPCLGSGTGRWYELHFGTATVSFADDAPFDPHAKDDVWTTAHLRTCVDQRDVSLDSPIRARTRSADANRFHGWLGIGLLRDKRTGQRLLWVMQAIDPHLSEPSIDDYAKWVQDHAFRLLFVDDRGTIKEERFRFRERRKPLYRAGLVRRTTAMGAGYYLDELPYPTIYDLWHPWGFAAVGLVLMTAGIARIGYRSLRGIRDQAGSV